MFNLIIPLVVFGIMAWVYAAVLLLLVLLLLIVAPLFGIYGDKNPEISSDGTESESVGDR